jgi:hypothetical protein
MMFCPKCGQEQMSEVLNFCSRCGFQLTEVTSLLARGGAPAEAQRNTPRDKLRRRGLRLLMAALASFVVALLSAANEADAGVAIFGFLTVASFFIASCLLISSWIKARKRGRSQPAAVGQPTGRMEATYVGALPPASEPVAMPRARFEQGELAQHPSVTEHTTRQLEHEPPRERERTR